MKPGSLFLLPGFIGENENSTHLSAYELELFNELKVYFCENEKTARRFLRRAGFTGSFDEIELHRLDKDSNHSDIQQLLGILLSGQNAGILSEAGAPAIADPGTILVREAHRKNIPVVPVPGPSAIMMAIMASGLNGQSFSFLGYLPVDKQERKKQLKLIEKSSGQKAEAMFFIETPYRNSALLEDMLAVLNPATLIHVSCNISQPDSIISTKAVSEWKKTSIDLHKKPCVFGILSTETVH
ncbi:MAG: SAM-dependent methyltransferase [Bacteroidia bacterium]